MKLFDHYIRYITENTEFKNFNFNLKNPKEWDAYGGYFNWKGIVTWKSPDVFFF